MRRTCKPCWDVKIHRNLVCEGSPSPGVMEEIIGLLHDISYERDPELLQCVKPVMVTKRTIHRIRATKPYWLRRWRGFILIMRYKKPKLCHDKVVRKGKIILIAVVPKGKKTYDIFHLHYIVRELRK